jgi:23S rRNA pseudouridine2605 synthase
MATEDSNDDSPIDPSANATPPPPPKPARRHSDEVPSNALSSDAAPQAVPPDGEGSAAFVPPSGEAVQLSESDPVSAEGKHARGPRKGGKGERRGDKRSRHAEQDALRAARQTAAESTFVNVIDEGFDSATEASPEDLARLQRQLEEDALGFDAGSEGAAAGGNERASSAESLTAQSHVEGHADHAAEGDGARGEGDGSGDDNDTDASPSFDDAHGSSHDKRVLSPERDAPKLHKVLAQAGVGSRRDIEAWIAAGRVKVNGDVAHTGQRVARGDRVDVDGKPVHLRFTPMAPRVIVYHKPVGEIVSHDDPEQRPSVFRKMPRLMHGKWQSVGRLDINTEGLLLLTNHGELAHQLMHPRFGVEREYAVRVLGTLSDENRGKLLSGVDIDGYRASFKYVDDGQGEGVNRWYRVVIAEGRHREVRRLFDSVGLTVSRLIRIRYGLVVLPAGLKRGMWVDLPESDVQALWRLVGLNEGPRHQGQGAGHGAGRGAGDRPRRTSGPGQGQRQGQGEGHGHGSRGEGPRRGQGPQRNEPSGPRGPRNTRRDGPRDRFADGPPREPRAREDRGARLEMQPPPGFDPTRTAFEVRGGFKKSRSRLGGGKTIVGGEIGEGGDMLGAIPNPLQQTFDQRALKEANRSSRREYGDDDPIPNPLEQTFDQRALKEANRSPRRDYGDDAPIPNPLQQTYDRRPMQGAQRDVIQVGRRGGGRQAGNKSGQPDPMQTAVGYIGADAVRAKRAAGKGPRGGGQSAGRGPRGPGGMGGGPGRGGSRGGGGGGGGRGGNKRGPR